jgi:hypothetical protein
MDIIIENGVIHEIGSGLSREGATLVIEAEGRHVTPGLVDMHSHLGLLAPPLQNVLLWCVLYLHCGARAGVYSFPEDAHATQDGNEMTDPTLPQLRALDALGAYKSRSFLFVCHPYYCYYY